MSSKKLNRRDFLRMSALTAAGTVLAACQPQVVEKTVEVEVPVKETVVVKEEVEVEVEKTVVVEATAAPIEQVELEVWHTSEHELDPIIEAYESANPNVTVKLQYYPWGDFFEKLEIAYAGGAPPDVHRQDDDEIPYYAQRGILTPLEDYILDKLDREALYWSLIESTMIAGHMWVGVPASRVGNLLYNKTMFEEAGVDLPPTSFPSDEWTWDKFVDVCVQLSDPDALQYGIGMSYQEFCVSLGRSNGGDIFDKDCMEFLMAEEEMVWAIQEVVDLINIKEGAVDPETQDGLGGFSEMFNMGRLAMKSAQTRDLPAEDVDFEWDFAGRPTVAGKEPTVFAAIECYGVPTEAEHVGEGASFVTFMMSEAAQRILAETKSIIPINKKATEIWINQIPQNRQIMVDTMPYGRTNPFAVAFAQVQDIVWPLIMEVMAGRKTAQEAMDEAKPLADQALQEAGGCLGS